MKFTDPDGRFPKGCGDGSCEGVHISGSLEYRKGVRQNLEEVRSANPENARRIEVLENSDKAHRIVPLEREPETGGLPANRANAGPEVDGDLRADGSPGPGVGTVTAYDPDQSIGSGTPDRILAHEFAGHAYERDQGIRDSTPYEKDPNITNSENAGRNAERRHLGLKEQD
jgi:hypothetical protein